MNRLLKSVSSRAQVLFEQLRPWLNENQATIEHDGSHWYEVTYVFYNHFMRGFTEQECEEALSELVDAQILWKTNYRGKRYIGMCKSYVSMFEAPPIVLPTKTWSRKNFSRETQSLVFSKAQGHCWYCGTVMDPFRSFSIDHVTPISKGGTEDPSNLVPCCRRCNTSKGDRSIEHLRVALMKHAGMVFTDAQTAFLASHKIIIPQGSWQFYFEREELQP